MKRINKPNCVTNTSSNNYACVCADIEYVCVCVNPKTHAAHTYAYIYISLIYNYIDMYNKYQHQQHDVSTKHNLHRIAFISNSSYVYRSMINFRFRFYC